MPALSAENKLIIAKMQRFCASCFSPLIIKLARDIERKRFCSRACNCKWQSKHGNQNRPVGVDHFRWRTGPPAKKNRLGYIQVSMSHVDGTSGVDLEHRVVMGNILGRKLFPTEHVHHINGIRDDNHPDNLELWTKLRQPTGIRVSDHHCPGCRCYEGAQ